MELTPEERRKIYEEEKARIEAREQIEQARRKPDQDTTVNMEPNIIGFLCYLGVWITGIIFLAIEKKNNWIRFHAAQSLVVFGFLFLASLFLGWIPVVGIAFRVIIGIIGFILWIVLMVKAYNGERYKVIIAGDIAESIVSSPVKTSEYTKTTASTEHQATAPEFPETETVAGHDLNEKIDSKIKDYFEGKRAGRITGSAFAIAWSIVLLVFFNFFNEYVAYYNADTVGNTVVWTRSPFFTGEISLWLPILNATLAVAILGHIVLIILDRQMLRRVIRFVIDIFSLATVLTLLSVFPFDFSVIPDSTIAAGVEVGVTVVLICISVGIGISLLVRLIKILVEIAKLAPHYKENT